METKLILKRHRWWFLIYAVALGLGLIGGKIYQSRPARPVAAVILPRPAIDPAWGQVIPEIRLSKPTLQQAVAEAGRLSGADIQVDWDSFTLTATRASIVDADINLRNVTLKDLLSQIVLATSGDYEHRRGLDDIACLPSQGKIYVTANREGPAYTPVERMFDVADILRAIERHRQQHPLLQADPRDFWLEERATGKPDELDYHFPTTDEPVVRTVELDLSQFVTAALEDEFFFQKEEGNPKIIEGTLIASQPRLAIDEIQKILSVLRLALVSPVVMPKNQVIADPIPLARRQMVQVLPSVDIPVSTLPEAIANLRSAGDANIFVSFGRSDRSEISKHRIAIKNKNLTMEQALNQALTGWDLAAFPIENIIWIRPYYGPDPDPKFTRYYNLKGLLDRKEDEIGARHLPADADWSARANQLIAHIVSGTSTPESSPWPEENNYPETDLRIVGGVLVVKNSLAIQKTVSEILRKHQEAR